MLVVLFASLACAHFGLQAVLDSSGNSAATTRDQGTQICSVYPPSPTQNCGLGLVNTSACAASMEGCAPCAFAPAVTGTLPSIAAGQSVTFTIYVSENHCTMGQAGNSSPLPCSIVLQYAPTNVDADITSSNLVNIGTVDMTQYPIWQNASLSVNSTGAVNVTFTMPTWTSAFSTGTIVASWECNPDVPHKFFSCADFQGTVGGATTAPGAATTGGSDPCNQYTTCPTCTGATVAGGCQFCADFYSRLTAPNTTKCVSASTSCPTLLVQHITAPASCTYDLNQNCKKTTSCSACAALPSSQQCGWCNSAGAATGGLLNSGSCAVTPCDIGSPTAASKCTASNVALGVLAAFVALLAALI